MRTRPVVGSLGLILTQGPGQSPQNQADSDQLGTDSYAGEALVRLARLLAAEVVVLVGYFVAA